MRLSGTNEKVNAQRIYCRQYNANAAGCACAARPRVVKSASNQLPPGNFSEISPEIGSQTY